MYKKKYSLLVVSVLFLFLIMSFVSAVPPFEENVGTIEGLQIFEQKIDYLPLNENFEMHIHISNISNGFPIQNTDIDCMLHLYNTSGKHTLQILLENNLNTFDKELEILGGNFSDIGQQSFIIWCNNSNLGGTVRGSFWVTEGGVEITDGRSKLTIGLLFILVLFFFMSLFFMFNMDDYKGKFALYWVSHLLFILINFIAWQVGVEGVLGSMALTGVFRIIFWVSTIAVFPMILLSMAWIFYIHAFNEHVENLLDKGMDTESAYRMAKKKSNNGWFGGK